MTSVEDNESLYRNLINSSQETKNSQTTFVTPDIFLHKLIHRAVEFGTTVGTTSTQVGAVFSRKYSFFVIIFLASLKVFKLGGVG